MTKLVQADPECRRCTPGYTTSVFVGESCEQPRPEAGHWTCLRHATPDEQALVVDQTRRAIARGARKFERLPEDFLSADWAHAVNWPYGCQGTTTRERLLLWLEAEDLRWSRGPTYCNSCLRWVKLGYCRMSRGCETSIRRVSSGLHSWVDHITHWQSKGNKRRVLVSQPYLTLEDSYNETLLLTLDPDVRVEVRDDGWYGVNTTFIGIWGGEDK